MNPPTTSQKGASPLLTALIFAPWETVQLLLAAGARTDVLADVTLKALKSKRASTSRGASRAYLDAAEKLALLEKHGLDPDRIARLHLHDAIHLLLPQS